MPHKKVSKQPIALLRGAIDELVNHPLIFLPFATVAFIQLLLLEILYFSPRVPLSHFFNPIVRTLWGVRFIHYPDNLVILPKLFQYVQIPLYIFVSSYFIGVAIAAISAINDGREISFGSACREALTRYVHILVGAFISFIAFYGLHKVYGLFAVRALRIRSTEGIFFIIKSVVLQGTPYFNLLIGIFVTAVFAFVFPIIIVEKKKILSALAGGLKHLWGSFWFILFVVLLPTLLYLPVRLLRSNVDSVAVNVFPEVRVLVLVVSVLVTMCIDAVVYTAITTYYLLKKEHS